MAVLFCTVLAIQRSVSVESSDGARDGLRLSGIDPAGLYLGKAAAVAAQLVVLEVLLAVGVVLLYGARIEVPWLDRRLVRARHHRPGRHRHPVRRAVVGPAGARDAAAVPAPAIVAPVLLAGTRIWQAAMAGGTPSDGTEWLRLLVVFDAVYLAVGVVLFGPIQETA